MLTFNKLFFLYAISFLWMSNSLFARPAVYKKSSNTPVQEAKVFFDKKNCPKVISLLEKFDFSKALPLQDEEMFADAYHMLAICYFELGELEKAKSELRSLLFLKPEFEFDLFVTPPPLSLLLEELKQETIFKTKELRKVKEEASKPNLLLEKQAIYQVSSPLTAVVPFGLPQFENKKWLKGSVLASLQLGFLGLNIGSYWVKKSFLSPETGNATSVDALHHYKTAQTLQWVSLALLLATYGYGVLEALLSRKISTIMVST